MSSLQHKSLVRPRVRRQLFTAIMLITYIPTFVIERLHLNLTQVINVKCRLKRCDGMFFLIRHHHIRHLRDEVFMSTGNSLKKKPCRTVTLL